MNLRGERRWARFLLSVAFGLTAWCGVSLGRAAESLEVDSDEGFLRLPGVVGTGTADDPFVITGVFDAQGGPFALRIRNTRAHFVIEGAVFRGASEAGLWLENVDNGWVVACVFEGNEVGVKVGGERVKVTFTLNTFRANRRHATGRAQGVRWDDGYVGNFWEGYQGVDKNGDGIGEVPHWVIPIKGAWDRFPLVAPLFGIEPPEGAVLIQFRANVGDRVVAEVEMSMSIVAKFLEEELRDEMRGRIVAEGVVVGRYGGGSYYELRVTVLEEEWTETPSEEMEPTPSVAERVRIHRFGAWEEKEPAPFPFYHKGWPNRWLRVGDTWTHEGEFGADAIGLSGGTIRYREVYKLEKIEERNGRPVAVVAITGEIELQSLLEEDPLPGRLEMYLKGATSGMIVVDLRSGATPELSLSFVFLGEMVAYGMPGEMELRIQLKGKERVFEAPAKPAVAEEEDRLQRLEAQLQELAEEVAALRETVQAQAQRLAELAQARPLRIGVVDVEAVFSQAFLAEVQEERAAMEAKVQAILVLQAEYTAGEIEPATYMARYLALQAELVQTKLHILQAMLDRMLALPGFAPLREELGALQREAQRLHTEAEALMTKAKAPVGEPTELRERLQKLHEEVQRLDHHLTQLAAVKILEIARQVAEETGMDLVLRTQDVVLYHREAEVIDLSPAVEARLRALFQEGR